MRDLYIAVRREGWFPRVMEISAEFEAARDLQAAAEDLWSASVETRDESGLYRSDAMSQEVARVQVKSSRRIQAWHDETKKVPSRKTRYIWYSARDGLLLQGAGLLLELLVWERQLTYPDLTAQQDLARLNGNGIGHCAFGGLIIDAIKRREKEAPVVHKATEASQRNQMVLQTRDYLMRTYPVVPSRWHAWGGT